MAASRCKKIDQTHLNHCLFTFCLISICQFKCCFTLGTEPITCTPVENVRMGDSVGTTVVCHFHKNVYTSRNAFSVVHYPFQASADIPGTDAVVCIWVDADRTRPECAVRDGYRMNYNITTDVIIDILNVSASTAGRYACHLVPLEDRSIEMCEVRIPDPVTAPTAPTTETLPEDTTITTDNGSDKTWVVVVGCVVPIVAVLLIIGVIFFVRRRKRARQQEITENEKADVGETDKLTSKEGKESSNKQSGLPLSTYKVSDESEDFGSSVDPDPRTTHTPSDRNTDRSTSTSSDIKSHTRSGETYGSRPESPEGYYTTPPLSTAPSGLATNPARSSTNPDSYMAPPGLTTKDSAASSSPNLRPYVEAPEIAHLRKLLMK